MNTDIEEKRRAIAGRLRLARGLAGLSQSQVARLLGLARPAISEIEAGRRRVAAEELGALAGIYAVDAAWLSQGRAPGSGSQDDCVALADRELAKRRPEDLSRVLDLLTALRSHGEP